MIANISPASTCFSETLSTLKFAQRAKMIKNNASINQESTGSIENLRKEIARLKEELSGAKTMIHTLENGERTRLKGSDLTSSQVAVACKKASAGKLSLKKDEGKMDIESYKNIIFDSNSGQLELELLLKELIDVVRESESHLQSEMERKNEFLQMFENLCELHRGNDINIRELLSMYDFKLNKIYSKQPDPNFAIENEICPSKDFENLDSDSGQVQFLQNENNL